MKRCEIMWLLFLTIIGGGCDLHPSDLKSPAPVTSQLPSNPGADPPMANPTEFPILRIKHSDGDDALLQYKLTESERALFKEMDSAVVALGNEIDLNRCHNAVVPIGKRHGLNEQQAIAFWTRTTFSEFEP